MNLKHIGVIWVAATLGSCGGDIRSFDQPEVSSSPVVLTTIPKVLITKRLYTRTLLRIAPSSEEAKFFYAGGTSSVAFPNGAILAAREYEVGGILYVLLSVVDRTTEACTIYRVHDADGDWLPDASTKVPLADSGSKKSYVTSISPSTDGIRYLLDRRCQDVFRFVDTDSDGWEDDWESSPIVRSADFPWLIEARTVYGGDGNVPKVRVYPVESAGEVSLRLPIMYREYTDDDLDGVAETEVLHDPAVGAPPRFGLPPQEGVLKISVDYTRGGGSANDVVEAWTLDGQGNEDVLLGSVTLDASLLGAITLTSSLLEGTRVALKKSGSPARTASLVWPDGPTILGVEPGRVLEGQATTIEVKGHRFTQDSRVWMQDRNGDQVRLTTTYVDTETLDAQIPAGSLVAGVRCYLSVFDEDSSGDFTVPGVNFVHLGVYAQQ